MKQIATIAILATAATGMLSTAANATWCTSEPVSKWMSVAAITAKAENMGYKVRKVEIDDNCYEVYGIKDGQRMEAYFHPITAELVKQKIDD